MSLPTTHRGAAMLMTLVMLLLIGAGSAMLMESALHTDRAALAARVHQQARQAAGQALRHCEQELIRADQPWNIQNPPAQGQHWQRWASWQGSPPLASPIKLPDLPAPPQCLAEPDLLPDGTPVLILTARGFSPDYRADSHGRTLAGAVAWQQFVLLMARALPDPVIPGASAGPDPHQDGSASSLPGGTASGVPGLDAAGGCPEGFCRMQLVGAAGQPRILCLPKRCTSPAGACCDAVVLDRVWRPLLNPPQPEVKG